MDSLPETYGIRKMHAAELSGSADTLFMFLSGWFGGPQRYSATIGHPHLRARHLPFPIGGGERDQWMLCMRTALTENIANVALRDSLVKALGDLADFMRNRPE